MQTQTPVLPALTQQADHWERGFQGTPGAPYRIEFTTNHRSKLGVATADDAGVVRFNDPISADAARFYRSDAP